MREITYSIYSAHDGEILEEGYPSLADATTACLYYNGMDYEIRREEDSLCLWHGKKGELKSTGVVALNHHDLLYRMVEFFEEPHSGFPRVGVANAEELLQDISLAWHSSEEKGKESGYYWYPLTGTFVNRSACVRGAFSCWWEAVESFLWEKKEEGK